MLQLDRYHLPVAFLYPEIIIMAKRYPKAKTVSPFVQLVTQYARIKSTYTNIKSAQMNKHSRSFEIVMDITPSENSNTYEVKISYEIGKKPQAILLSPALKEYDGKMPHHIYGFDKNGHAILCVYCPYKGEWTSSMPIAESFIPWVSTWLNTYEYWLITGEWNYNEIKCGSPKE